MFAYTGGLQGVAGAQGDQGDQGDPGIQGAQGDPGLPFASRFGVHRTAAQSIPVTAFTKVEFNVEEYDDNSEYDHVTTYLWTCKTAGKYSMGAMVGFEGLIDTEHIQVLLRKNGSDTICSNADKLGAAGTGDGVIGGDFEFAVDDTVEVWAYHNKDAGKNTGVVGRCRFWGHRIV